MISEQLRSGSSEKTPKRRASRYSIAILAGGVSSRMGRDKTQLRLGRRTLLDHVVSIAVSLRVPVRVIRQDLLPPCGPLGGIFTALKTSYADAELFMASDMPFVRPSTLLQLVRAFQRGSEAVFVAEGTQVGFPFLFPVKRLAIVENQIRSKQFSLHSLAAATRAAIIECPASKAHSLFNINTPDDWIKARKAWLKGQTKKDKIGKERSQNLRGQLISILDRSKSGRYTQKR